MHRCIKWATISKDSALTWISSLKLLQCFYNLHDQENIKEERPN